MPQHFRHILKGRALHTGMNTRKGGGGATLESAHHVHMWKKKKTDERLMKGLFTKKGMVKIKSRQEGMWSTNTREVPSLPDSGKGWEENTMGTEGWLPNGRCNQAAQPLPTCRLEGRESGA